MKKLVKESLNEDAYYEPRHQWKPLKPGEDQVNEFEKVINEKFPITTPEGREDWWFIDRVFSYPEASDGTAWFVICTNDNGKKHMSFRSDDLYNDVRQDGSLSSHESGSAQVWNNPGNDDYEEGEND